MIKKVNQDNETHDIYIYLNKSDINENFIDYYRKGTFEGLYYSIIIDKLMIEKFYIVISQPNVSSSNEVTIIIFSTYNYYLTNCSTFYQYSIAENITVKIASNFTGKYLKFAYKRISGYSYHGRNNFMIFENDFIVYKRLNNMFNEDFIKVRNDYSYTIILDFQTKADYYLLLTENPYFLPVEINTQDYQFFPVIQNLNLSLDISKIEYKYKFLVRYINYREVRIKAYGYYTDNYNEIENTQGK